MIGYQHSLHFRKPRSTSPQRHYKYNLNQDNESCVEQQTSKFKSQLEKEVVKCEAEWPECLFCYAFACFSLSGFNQFKCGNCTLKTN